MQRLSPFPKTRLSTLPLKPITQSPDSTIATLEQLVAKEPQNEEYKSQLAIALVIDSDRYDWKDPRSGGSYCISLQGLEHARKQVTRASQLQVADPALQKDIAEALREVNVLGERYYCNSWFVLVVLGLFTAGMGGVVWWYVNRRPQFLINRDAMSAIQAGKNPEDIHGAQGKIFSFAEAAGGQWGGIVGLVAVLVFSPILAILAYKRNYLDVKKLN
jgi:hypothetical protein